MTDAERREAARQFYQKWVGRGREDEEDRSYWLDILERVLGVKNATDHIEFQKKVIVDGHTKRIDAYIPETKVIIEQKTLGICLDKKGYQSGGIELTPYEQAKRYNDNLPYDEKARWIITSNFSEIWIYDMNMRVPEPVKIKLDELQSKYMLLDFLIKKEKKHVSQEIEISTKAGDIVGNLYNALAKQYINPESSKALKSLNILCVRLVFCLYAEDAGIFGDDRGMFHDYMESFDTLGMRKALIELFHILDTKEADRDPYDTSEVSKFPYVNGGLFKEADIEIPNFTDEIREVLLVEASEQFDWSKISPTIFGAVFESTLNSVTRRTLGVHFTSIENIHRIIDPLFLNDLKKQLNTIKGMKTPKIRKKNLIDFQKKLSEITWLDASSGSGNFLTETYICIRRLENEVIQELNQGQIVFGDIMNPIKVSIDQFYGIEINDFAVTVAKTALWIAENQMMKETEDIIHMELDFLPLKTNAYIIEGNALRMNWEDVIPKHKLNYIMGNPPFIGARYMSKEQKNDIINVFGKEWKGVGDLDYVCAWYKKCADFIKNTGIKCALVSTNSITQGVAVTNIWKPLFDNGISFDFAYRSFIWNSEAKSKAKVHCVIIGFSYSNIGTDKYIYENGIQNKVSNINGYLMEADNIFIDKRGNPISDVPQIALGGQAIDDGNFILTEEEMHDLITHEPKAKNFIRPYMMGKDFINRKPRYCLWLLDADPALIRACPQVMKRVQRVKEFRLQSKRQSTLKAAQTPTLFASINICDGNYIAIPKVSSQNRRYIPIDFLPGDVIAGDKLFIMPNANMFHFGVLNSNVHMAWTRFFCGRLKSDYSYSNTVVYNNFPWCNPSEEQKAKIEKTAQGILDARNMYPESSLADLYDPLLMPKELRHAHQLNDKAVMEAYGFSIKNTTEQDCVAALIELHKEIVNATI